MPFISLSLPNIYLIAALWIGLALLASLVSIRLGISVALLEIFMGVLAGNFLGIRTTPWIDFLASFGSVLLTFLAGAEIDPESLRKHLKASLSIGIAAFLAPSWASLPWPIGAPAGMYTRLRLLVLPCLPPQLRLSLP